METHLDQLGFMMDLKWRRESSISNKMKIKDIIIYNLL